MDLNDSWPACIRQRRSNAYTTRIKVEVTRNSSTLGRTSKQMGPLSLSLNFDSYTYFEATSAGPGCGRDGRKLRHVRSGACSAPARVDVCAPYPIFEA
jgi:hypothetical protein